MTHAPLLVVEDDPLTLRTMLRALSPQRAVGFRRAEDALSFVNDRTPRMVITDVDLPGMNGPELLATLARRGFRIPAVVVSGASHVPPPHHHRAPWLFLPKPFTAEALRAAVRMLDGSGHLLPPSPRLGAEG